jgi:hypothetical protein
MSVRVKPATNLTLMAAANRVFGPDGESVGRVRDIVAGLRTDRQPPRALGIVIEVLSRRRIFVPMLRVTSIEPNAVTLATGRVNLRRFSQRPNEILVVGQLLDVRVRFAASNGTDEVTAVVIDAAIEQTRTRDWLLTKLAVQERSRLLARRGSLRVLAWEDTAGLGLPDLSAQPQGAHQLLAARPTWPAPCSTCRRNAATRWPTHWTTSDWPTSSRNYPRTTRRNCSATSATSGPRTYWRR